MTTIEVTTFGNVKGVVLPEAILKRLRVSNGGLIYLLETPEGIELKPYDPEFAEQMKVAEQVMREDYEALQELAK